MFNFSHPNRETKYRETTNSTNYGGPRRQCKVCKQYKGTGGGTIKDGFCCKECKK